MNSAKHLANRFREVLLNGTWIANTNYKHQLSDMTWQQATTKVHSLNTIAALTYHINYYQEGIINVFEGGALKIRDKYSFDCPPITSKEEWEHLLNALLSNAEKFANHVEQIPDDKLNDDFVEAKYGSYLRNIEGIIEHSYYHLGQISLIHKILLNRK